MTVSVSVKQHNDMTEGLFQTSSSLRWENITEVCIQHWT